MINARRHIVKDKLMFCKYSFSRRIFTKRNFSIEPKFLLFKFKIFLFSLSACKTKENFDSVEKFRLVENRLKGIQQYIFLLFHLEELLKL